MFEPGQRASRFSREKTQSNPAWFRAIPYSNSDREPTKSCRRLGSSRGLSPDCEGRPGETAFVADGSRVQGKGKAHCDPEDRAWQDHAHNAAYQGTRAHIACQVASAKRRA